MRIEVVVREESGLAREREAVTVGVPLPRGAVREAGALVLLGPRGEPVPVQTAVVERWSDGSVRWSILDFQVAIPAHGEARFALVDDAGSAVLPADAPRVRTSDGGSAVIVETGAARFEAAPGAAFPFRSVRVDGVERIAPERCTLRAEDAAGHAWTGEIREVDLEADGPLRATLRLAGRFTGEGDGVDALRFTARATLFAGSAIVRVELTVGNARRALHPGGIWELGDPGSILLRDLSLAAGAVTHGAARFATEPRHALEAAAREGVEIRQESSGGTNWRSRVHVARDGTVPMTFRGFRVRTGGSEREGLRATPRATAGDDAGGVGVTMRHFWENFPKTLEADAATVTLRLFPRQSVAPHELQGGERKTHEIALGYGAAARSPALAALAHPLAAAPDPGSMVAAGALPHLSLRSDTGSVAYERLVDEAFGENGFPGKRERDDEYGWRHFGEMPADHESRGWTGEGTFVSHYNNQYDAVLGALHQFARGGDPRWFRLADELARHVMDVDIYHTDADRPAYNHGLFWPTVHYVDAGRATHRTYPRGTEGGGPDNEHNYTTGLRLWGLLTGNPRGREASLEGARRARDADDGGRTVFRWVVRGPTGLASKTRDFAYHGPGRGAANTIVAFLDAWRTTGDDDWLARCEEIIRRTIHPLDDVAARDLLDVENRWSYTVYLQALGRYLDEMAEAGRVGAAYAWARESLLAYARWMAEHERPTLSRPEALEYPTETWPAQDLRKADVFAYAALCATGEERARFAGCARRFRDESVAALETFPTRTYTRPLVLLSRYGPLVDWLERHPDAALPPPAETPRFGRPARFVPQKTRAVRRVRDAVALAAVAGAGFALARILGA